MAFKVPPYEFADILIRRAMYIGGEWLHSIRCRECKEKFENLIAAEKHVVEKHGRQHIKVEPWAPRREPVKTVFDEVKKKFKEDEW